MIETVSRVYPKKASTRRVNRKIADSTQNQRVFFSRYLTANYASKDARNEDEGDALLVPGPVLAVLERAEVVVATGAMDEQHAEIDRVEVSCGRDGRWVNPYSSISSHFAADPLNPTVSSCIRIYLAVSSCI